MVLANQEAPKKIYWTSFPFIGVDPPDPPTPPTPPFRCPHPDKKGTNLLLFKFCIHLHTHQDPQLKFAELWGKTCDTDARVHMTYQAPITGLHGPKLLPFQ